MPNTDFPERSPACHAVCFHSTGTTGVMAKDESPNKSGCLLVDARDHLPRMPSLARAAALTRPRAYRRLVPALA